MSGILVPIITRAGLAALVNAKATGLKATIVAVAIGRGNATSGGGYVGYTPNGGMTALATEVARVPLLTGAPLGNVAGADPIGFRVMARVPALAPGATAYAINEVGYILDDGTLLALLSDPASPVAFRTALADFDVAQDLLLQQLPTANLAISVLEPDIPDVTGVLAALLRGHALNTTEFVTTNERLTLRGL